MSAQARYTPPKRTNTTRTVDQDGNTTEQWTGEGQPRVGTHDYTDEDAINERLFGKGAVKKTQSIKTSYDNDGNEVKDWDGEDAPGIRTHDHSNEDEINERLFGSKAPKAPPRTNTATRTYRNADGDEETVHAGEEAPGIRTHDHSNEDEINERLFGKGAKSTR